MKLAWMAGEGSLARSVYRGLYWKVVHPMKSWLMVQRRMRGYRGGPRLLRTVRPYTMVGLPRLLNAFDLARDVEARGMPGAIVECGVFKGGCAGLMASVAANAGSSRKVWLFDSFEGLPEPGPLDGQKAADYSARPLEGKLVPIDRCVGLLETVEGLLFGKLGLDRRNIVIRKGWFQDTLPAARDEIGAIAILRLDGDWYESTKVCFDNLYDLVVPGGFVIIDDYGHWEGCRRATDDFLRSRDLRPHLRTIDEDGVFFVKP